MISCPDCWPWTKPGYITMTQRPSNNQWMGSIEAHLAPNKFREQKSAGKVSPRFIGIKTASSSLIIFQRTKLLTRSITYLCWCNLRTFEGKTPPEGHQGGLLPRQCPGSPGTCNPDETGLPGLPMSWSSNLFSGSGAVGLPPVPWTEKNNWKFAIFLPTRRLLLPRRIGWTDKLLNFFEWLSKVRKMG